MNHKDGISIAEYDVLLINYRDIY